MMQTNIFLFTYDVIFCTRANIVQTAKGEPIRFLWVKIFVGRGLPKKKKKILCKKTNIFLKTFLPTLSQRTIKYPQLG